MNRSSYYKWKKSSKSKKELQDEELAALILEYHETFDGILGYRRMTTFINKFNEKDYSWKYVRRIMKILKVKSRIRQKKSNYKKVKPEQVGENILNRQFKADYPNQKWLTDVTEFKIVGHKQKIYLSAILDLYGKNIVAYKLSYRNDNKLVFDTFDLAKEKFPYAKPIFHSDRGFQYTSKQFKIKLNEVGMIQSMSRVGKCIDNGPMEAFWGTLKAEMFYGMKFKSLDELMLKIESYIFFYNNFRIQGNLKGMTPNEFTYHSSCNYIYF